MNITDYTYLINKPDAINERQNALLEKIISDFPYFQSARVLRLKYLFKEDSFRYNYALKVAAAHTTDRSILFNFITSDTFKTINKELYQKKTKELLDINVFGSEEVKQEYTIKEDINPIEKSILSSIKEASPDAEIEENKLQIGKPLNFSPEEKHSFEEWLQLSRLTPIERKTETKAEEESLDQDLDKIKKQEIIDKFIETNPKIQPIVKDAQPFVFQPIIEENSYIMTETLAKVYLEQKKYQKAIQAYEILILKYPEKSSFFANQITEIKKIQYNNN